MKKNLIIRISNGLGNQLFTYASAFAFAKKLDRNLLIDNESSFKSKKNIQGVNTSYSLDIFNITSPIAPKKLKFIGYKGYLKRKILKKIDYLKSSKSFLLEKKDFNKISFFDETYLNKKFSNNLYMEGHFESEKYFSFYKNDILNQYNFKSNLSTNNIYLNQLKATNSVCLCIRQNRFEEGTKKNNSVFNKKKSWKFTLEQISYIHKSVNLLKKRLDNPKFYLWSNNFNNLKQYFPDTEFIFIDNNLKEEKYTNFLLMTYAKHYIVSPTSYNWWGAWLSKNVNNSIRFRPDDNFFNDYHVNNKDFWPTDWEVISKF